MFTGDKILQGVLSALTCGWVLDALYITLLVLSSEERRFILGEEWSPINILIAPFTMIAVVLSIQVDTILQNRRSYYKAALDLFFLRLAKIFDWRVSGGDWLFTLGKQD
jgi:hypothetical protein